MPGRIAIIAAVAAGAIVVGAAAGLAKSDKAERPEPNPGEPTIEIVSPRNGARQSSHAVVVKVNVHNFELAPQRFGALPELGRGHLRFSLNRVPDCVDPVKLRRAEESAIGKGRLKGASFDYPEFAGANGVLAERIGSDGAYSPATRPEIYYENLHAGLYRLVITIVENNGATSPYHAVTNFQILSKPGKGPKSCPDGKVSSAKAESLVR